MKKSTLKVPRGINYISDWKDFEYPLGRVIVDKQICGCGFTEYCLRNQEPIILASPRKVLLENKKEQHMKDSNVYYFRNEADGPGNLKIVENLSKTSKVTREDYLKSIKLEFQNWLMFSCTGIPKILVTYDSLHHVLDALGPKQEEFKVVVDEFQSIFTDAQFKAEVENNLLIDLSQIPNVLFLSATPMMDRYLSALPDFSSLDYIELEWPEDTIQTVNIVRKESKSLSKDISKIISDFRKGILPSKVLPDGSVAVSREVVFYVNSVKEIVGTIRKNKLTVEECNIICAQNSSNLKFLKTIKHSIGKIPLKGAPHKMFTFCTRTTFLGADFYSTCASTVICSDCNVNSLSLDVVLDLPQIIGRQRLRENIFKNECLLLYKVQDKEEDWRNIQWEEFNSFLEIKRNNSKTILNILSKLEGYERDNYIDTIADLKEISNHKFEKNFIGISYNKATGRVPAYNKLAEISEIRAFEVTRDLYLNTFVVRRTLEEAGFSVDQVSKETVSEMLGDVNSDYLIFIDHFTSETKFSEKMSYYCKFLLAHFMNIRTTNIEGVPEEYQNFVNLLGPEKILALKCQKSLILVEYRAMYLRSSILDNLRDILDVTGSTIYLRAELKQILSNVYSNLEITKAPKAIDLLEMIPYSKVHLIDENTGIEKKGYKIKPF